MKPTQLLHDLGQSLWLDNITRDLLDNGTLKSYIDELLGDWADVESDDLSTRPSRRAPLTIRRFTKRWAGASREKPSSLIWR